jgi:hypothetical protein
LAVADHRRRAFLSRDLLTFDYTINIIALLGDGVSVKIYGIKPLFNSWSDKKSLPAMIMRVDSKYRFQMKTLSLNFKPHR